MSGVWSHDLLKNSKTYLSGNSKPVPEGVKKGGTRVYFAVVDGYAILLNAEVKTGDTPSANKLEEAAEILLAHRRGIPVF